MRLVLAILLALSVVWLAHAEEPRGCDKFTLSPAVPPADRLALQPIKDAKLLLPPERAPKDTASFAGMRMVQVSNAGLYQISVSDYAWIDVVQDGRYVKPGKFSGALDCAGLRKIVRFELKPGAVAIQLSGVSGNSIALSFTPASP